MSLFFERERRFKPARARARLTGLAARKPVWLCGVFLAGCATLFGWDIHAPAVLSESFYQMVSPAERRVALYLMPETRRFISENRGGKLADPQTYHVGEAFTPMAVEAFQRAFSEFIFMESEPTPEILKRYAIPCVAAVAIERLQNRVTLKGQALVLESRVELYADDGTFLAGFEVEGASEARKVFGRRGGPQVNLNAAIENNLRATALFLQDVLAHPPAKKTP